MIIHSPLINPYDNLDIEDYLFEHLVEGERILFLWKNLPSVILGRSQNPWYEVNLPYIREKNISLLKRSSGGGTVYHDLGNLNISFMEWIPAIEYMQETQKEHLDLILQALRNVGIVAEKNHRNDLLIDQKKISGSAYRLSKRKLLHHCTLLMSSHLQSLRDSLNSAEKPFIQCRSVKSVSSSVTNVLPEHSNKQSFEKDFRSRLGDLWDAGSTTITDSWDLFKKAKEKGRQIGWGSSERIYRGVPAFFWRGKTINPKDCDLDFPWSN